jgi:hypothetical protein
MTITIPSLAELEFYAEGHRYIVRGRELPSVTTLMRRFGLGFQGFAPQEALDRGNYVHAASVLIDEDDLDETSVPPKWGGYLEGYRRAVSSTQTKMIVAEWRFWHPLYAYCGTLDRIGFRGGRRGIISLKTGDKTDANVQEGAYEQGWIYWHPDKPLEWAECWKLNDNGSCDREPLDLKDGWRIFSACLVIEEQRRKTHGNRRNEDRPAA